jgi:hypothetical protein
VCDTPITARDGCTVGAGFPVRVSRSGPPRFLAPSWGTLWVRCSPWESQSFDFRFYRTVTQPAVRIRPDGRFIVTRRGVFEGRGYLAGHRLVPALGARATLRLKGRFTRPGIAVGVSRVTVTNGCRSRPQPFRLRHRPTGWSDLLDRA